jgi:hypothetical protein
MTDMTASPAQGDLPLVRRLEAVGFRAWPAASVVYDGSWQVRLTGSHPSKRLNCIVPLDPSDYRDMDLRLSKARKRFADYGRSLVVRETPLAPPHLIRHLEDDGWQMFETADVMIGDLAHLPLPPTLGHLPSHDIGRFVDACIAVGQDDAALKPALAEILSSIKPQSGFFIKESPRHGAVANGSAAGHRLGNTCLGTALGPRQRRPFGMAAGGGRQRTGDCPLSPVRLSQGL